MRGEYTEKSIVRKSNSKQRSARYPLRNQLAQLLALQKQENKLSSETLCQEFKRLELPCHPIR